MTSNCFKQISNNSFFLIKSSTPFSSVLCVIHTLVPEICSQLITISAGRFKKCSSALPFRRVKMLSFLSLIYARQSHVSLVCREYIQIKKIVLCFGESPSIPNFLLAKLLFAGQHHTTHLSIEIPNQKKIPNLFL
jgi:hypothetical protein